MSTPDAGPSRVPSFFSTRTVKVCGSPTLFVPDVPIVIRASTNRFVAGPLPAGPLVPEVERVTEAVLGVPPALLKLTVVLALAVNTVGVGLLTVSVHE